MSLDHSLYKYLISTGALPLPGLGTLRVQEEPASYQVAEKQFLPPVFRFLLDPEEGQSPRPLFDWIAVSLSVGENEAIESLNAFANHIKYELGQTKRSVWEGVGTFKKDLAGGLSFQSEEIKPYGLDPLVAEKVIHTNATHTMLVGDRERTSEEMTAWLEGEETRRDWPMIIAWVLLGISLLIAGYQFTKGKGSKAPFGNEQPLRLDS